jgi:large subunit ribosomal protein L27
MFSPFPSSRLSFYSLLTRSLSLLVPSSALSSSSLASTASLYRLPCRFATKKAGGSSKNSNDSAGRRLGLKVGNLQTVKSGMILMRQRGFTTHPGLNVGSGRDHTLFALKPGKVCFTYTHNDNKRSNRIRKYINVINEQEGQSEQDVKNHFEQVQKRLDLILKLRKEGRKLPTPRALYEKQLREQQKAEKKEKMKQILDKYNITSLYSLTGNNLLSQVPASLKLEPKKAEEPKQQ